MTIMGIYTHFSKEKEKVGDELLDRFFSNRIYESILVFKPVTVFDISQTESVAKPSVCSFALHDFIPKKHGVFIIRSDWMQLSTFYEIIYVLAGTIQ